MPHKDPNAKREYDRQWRADNHERVLEQARQYRKDNPELFRAAGQRYRAKRGPQQSDPEYNWRYRLKTKHGMTLEDWQALRDSQDGLCYLCQRPLAAERRLVHIDHDHSCCPKGFSCALCRRGLACRSCNLVVGLADDDPFLLTLIAENFSLRTTLAAGPSSRPLLENGVIPALTGDTARS